ncbi:hypothetical protein [Collimonas arenae]|uniref:hypothetical protein n=1 Tax=Collimonas arenae TaxID=279058 RepID=UPI003460675A
MISTSATPSEPAGAGGGGAFPGAGGAPLSLDTAGLPARLDDCPPIIMRAAGVLNLMTLDLPRVT